MSSFNERGELNISNGVIVTAVGKKRSGKTVVALMLTRSFPGDVIVIDVAHDDGPMGPGVIDITGSVDELPRRFPEHRRVNGERLILRHLPDAGSPTYREDIDAMIGLALRHSTREKPAMLVVHETGVVAEVKRVAPHTRRVLMHSRHSGLVCVFTMPRPVTVDPLVLGQADVLYAFDLPVPDDRRRVADTIGWDPPSFDEAMRELVTHGYLRHDANQAPPVNGEPDYRLVAFDPLPADEVQKVLTWSKNVPAPRE